MSNDGTWDAQDHNMTLSKGDWEIVRRDMADLPEPVRGTTDYESGTPVSLRWWKLAACLGAGNAQFYPEKGGHDAAANINNEYCSRCPVRVHCLTDALDRTTSEDWGICGGFSQRQRKDMRSAYRQGATVEALIVQYDGLRFKRAAA